MLLDPAIELLISLLFALLLLSASVHKFVDRQRFKGILAAYRLIPALALPLLVVAVPLLELVLGLAWLSSTQLNFVAPVTALLLAVYTLAIGINLLRGNVDIDCGCGFAGHSDNSTGYQRLSSGLLLRNGLLMALALATLLPANDRVLGIWDYLFVAFACFGLLLLYAAGNQLLANKQRIDSWRTPLLREADNGGSNV